MSVDDKEKLQSDKEKEEANEENDNKEEASDSLTEESKEFFMELEELEKLREERKEESRKKIERIVQEKEKMKTGCKESKEDGIAMIGGKITAIKTKDYVPKLKVFKHNKVNDFQNKGSDRIEKVLHKVHGITLKKKFDFLEALKAYTPVKSVLKKKDFDEFARRFKSKNFKSEKFRRAAKSGIDMKELRKEFGKRDIDKIRRGITGQEDPNKYQSRSSGLKNTTRPNRPNRPNKYI
jgi:hypothetical protein